MFTQSEDITVFSLYVTVMYLNPQEHRYRLTNCQQLPLLAKQGINKDNTRRTWRPTADKLTTQTTLRSDSQLAGHTHTTLGYQRSQYIHEQCKTLRTSITVRRQQAQYNGIKQYSLCSFTKHLEWHSNPLQTQKNNRVSGDRNAIQSAVSAGEKRGGERTCQLDFFCVLSLLHQW